MGKKDLILKGISILIDLLASFVLPMASDKIKDGFLKKEQQDTIKEEVQKYLEAH